MTARNRRLSVARAWAHDLQCMSEGCKGAGDNDHARRTQHRFARDAADCADTGVGVAYVIHDLVCERQHRDTGGCVRREAHAAALWQVGRSLQAAMEAAS